MVSVTQKNLFNWFLLVWFITGLVLNSFTAMSGEEAYYWLFSQHLDWGYLDHPPVIALLIKPGYWLFQNNLGIRLGTLLISIFTIIVMRQALPVKNDQLYIWILLGLLPVHLGTVILKTDVPLLFFTACFFLLYQHYLKNDSLKINLLLGLCIALMIMSKYHGVLVVFFTVLSNLPLFKRKSFYVVAIVTVLFLLPHVYWQYQNDFASIRFHLQNRDDAGFKWTNLTKFMWMQPIFLGPLLSFVLLAACIKIKTGSPYHRALKFTIGGVLLFFFISAFKLEIHKHWTSVLEVPMILLGHEYMTSRKRWQAVTRSISIFSLILVLLFRIYLAIDFLPASLSKDIEKLHGWNEWTQKIQFYSKGLPVVFIDQYDQASRYSYLTGKETHSYNTVHYRETQQDLWNWEEQLQGKEVLAVTKRKELASTIIDSSISRTTIYAYHINQFRSFRKVLVSLKDDKITGKKGDKIGLEVVLKNEYDHPVNFSAFDGRLCFLNAHFFAASASLFDTRVDTLHVNLAEGEQITQRVIIQLPDRPGVYDIRFSIQVEGIEPPINSKRFKVWVKD